MISELEVPAHSNYTKSKILLDQDTVSLRPNLHKHNFVIPIFIEYNYVDVQQHLSAFIASATRKWNECGKYFKGLWIKNETNT